MNRRSVADKGTDGPFGWSIRVSPYFVPISSEDVLQVSTAHILVRNCWKRKRLGTMFRDRWMKCVFIMVLTTVVKRRLSIRYTSQNAAVAHETLIEGACFSPPFLFFFLSRDFQLGSASQCNDKRVYEREIPPCSNMQHATHYDISCLATTRLP